MKLETSTGLEFEYDEKMLDDMELVDALCELQDNPTVLPKIIRMMMGEDGKAQLYEHCRDAETGKVSLSRVNTEVAEIFTLMTGAIKK